MQYTPRRHLLTVDVEASFRGLRGDLAGPHCDLDLPHAMEVFLDLLDELGVRATFFVLGADAADLSAFLTRCVAAGHEVACHGMHHVRADAWSPEEFRQDLRGSLAAIEDVAQVRCHGYRAPWFSAPAAEDWFFEILGENGIRYDASLRLPVETRLAGTSREEVVLLPVPMLKFGAARVGAVGGMALRVLPKWMISRMVRRCEQYHQPACVYLHPYEWYSTGHGAGGAVRMSLSGIRRGLLVDRSLPRLRWLVRRMEFTSIGEWMLCR